MNATRVVPLTLAAGAALTGHQVRRARRRYGGLAPEVSAVDVTVFPAGREDIGSPPVEMAAFGDSGMAGVGVQTVAESLPVQLAQRVADRLVRRVHVVGYARSGARTADVLAEQVPSAPPRVDISVLLVGTNDVIHLTPPRPLARDTAAVLDALVSLGGPVVISNLPEFRAMTALPHLLVEAAAAYAGVVRRVQQQAVRGRRDVDLVDVRGAVGAEFVRDTSTMSADLFHPSATGYGRIADVLAPAVVSALMSANEEEYR